MWELCRGPLPPLEQLEARQALAKQFAHILDFVLRFDELKMKTPAMQNDFSYYRRTMSRKWFAFGITVSQNSFLRVKNSPTKDTLKLQFFPVTIKVDRQPLEKFERKFSLLLLAKSITYYEITVIVIRYL